VSNENHDEVVEVSYSTEEGHDTSEEDISNTSLSTKVEGANTSDKGLRESRPVENLPYDAVFEVGNDSDELSFKTNSTDASRNTSASIEIPRDTKTPRYPIDDSVQTRKDIKNIESGEVSLSDNGDDDSSSVSENTNKVYGSDRFADLNVSNNIKEIFQYIDRYKPVAFDCNVELKCFIPNYIPTIGNIDPFLKMPRPDGVADGLGTKVIDEPASIQSDTAVLQLQLRSLSKKHHDDVVVRSILKDSGYGAEIDEWITIVSELHQTPILHEVTNITQNMPTLDILMQAWPIDFQDALESKNVNIPNPKLNLNVKEFATVVCLLLDIPVRAGSLIESLQILMTLYIAFQNNEHFAPSVQEN